MVGRDGKGRTHPPLSRKAKADEITCNTINAGTYVLEPKVLDYLPAGENYSFEYGCFPILKRRGVLAHIFPRARTGSTSARRRDIYRYTAICSNNRVRRIHIKERRGQFDAATVAEIDEMSMIGDDCQIKPGAQIINSVLGQGCFVEERARVENCVIWPHTRIGTTAQLNGAIAGRGCHIGRSAVVGPGTVLGDKTSLTDYTFT